MKAKYLEVSGRTFYAFEEPDFVGPLKMGPPPGFKVPVDGTVPTLENYRQGFWGGKRFDWVFGVILPVICIFFDPIVFNGQAFGESAWLGAVKPFAYALSFVSIMGMMAWLIWDTKLRGYTAALSGLFSMAGLCSFLIGCAILPLSLMGLIVLIGVLGFTPFLTAIVMFRNAERCFNAARSFVDRRTLVYSFILTLLASAVIPYLIQLTVGR